MIIYWYYFKDEPHPNGASSGPSKKPSISVEDILKKNSEVWKIYESGRFDVKQSFDNGNRKIVLKEKSSSPDTEYSIRKYRVRINHKGSSKNDDHLLLVSFSNNSSHSLSAIPENVATQGQYVDVNVEYGQAPQDYSNRQQLNQQHQWSGPGSDLIHKLIEGTDSFASNTPKGTFEFLEPEVHTLAGNYLVDQSQAVKPSKHKKEKNIRNLNLHHHYHCQAVLMVMKLVQQLAQDSP